MKRQDWTGTTGIKGWLCDPDDLEAYREIVAAWEEFWKRAWWYLGPPPVPKKIAFEQAGVLRILRPAPTLFFMLRRGGLIRHMRVIEEIHGFPVFEGTGEIMGSMTEAEALAFLAWKDIPRGINRVEVVEAIPTDYSRRNEWSLNDDGVIVAP